MGLIADLVAKHKHDGVTNEGLAFVLEHALHALHDTPDHAPLLEIGSYRGRTSLALLDLASRFTPTPFLFAADPYGGKPYNSGNGFMVHGGLYADAAYCEAKAALAGYANHAHFLMTGVEFLARVIGTPYWWQCQELKVGAFAFAFVDGDHNKATVVAELDLLRPHMASGGRIVVDNVDMDPRLLVALPQLGAMLGPADVAPGARQAVFRC